MASSDPSLKYPVPRRDDDRKSARPQTRRSSVLIADDSLDARELYALYLTYCGYRTHTAVDGGDAVDKALALRPDVIVMDLSMPTVDGITALRHLRSNRRTRAIPVILLTGYPATAIDRGAIAAGADVFLTKPCLPEDLETHVRRLMESKGGRSKPLAR